MIWWRKITWRTALLGWLITTATVVAFALALIPEQKRVFQENLQSKAYGVAVSLRNITSAAVVNEDYSSVVDQCVEMLKGDRSISYIILTRNDGFSLIHDRSGWRTLTLSDVWLPTRRTTRTSMGPTLLFQRPSFNFSEPFSYSGIEWGWIHVGLSLDTYDQSVRRVYFQTGLLALVFTVIGLGVMILYARYLLKPILDLQDVVRQVAEGDLSARASTDRTDELGQLARSVNSMTEALLRRDRALKETNETLEQRVQERTRALQDQIAAREAANRELAEAQRQLMQLSREAGRAEVATGVLHNVGNVLNSINISANLIQNGLTESPRLEVLKQVGELMQAQGASLPQFLASDPRGQLVPSLLMEIARQLPQDHHAIAKEAAQLIHNVDHVKQIVSAQQGFAKAGGLLQAVKPIELFEEALKITHGSFVRHEVQLNRHFEEVPPLQTDRHLVMQILVNFTTNAVQAVKPLDPAERQIDLYLSSRSGMVEFSVRDNGIGIASEDLKKIFHHGFTTRKDGHGFGLHSGALAAQTLGGEIKVESRGPGLGARFTLVLPIAPTRTNSSEKKELT
ncbi:MAG: ATP-binding protein [Nibricoccus sp.]